MSNAKVFSRTPSYVTVTRKRLHSGCMRQLERVLTSGGQCLSLNVVLYWPANRQPYV